MPDIRTRLIELREAYDLNITEFAKRINVSKSTISRYETGEMKPNIDVLLKIKHEFGVSLDWLAGYDTDAIAKYNPAIEECIENNIDPIDLLDTIEFLKKQRNK